MTKGQDTKIENKAIVGDMINHLTYHLAKRTLGTSVNDKNKATEKYLDIIIGDVKRPDNMDRHGGSMVPRITDVNPHVKGD